MRDTKENASGQEGVTDFVAREQRLWELHRLLNNRKGSSKLHLQEEHRGEHQGVRSQPEDHASRGRLGGGLRDL